jgi:6-phospho-beta-glucosidase
MVSGDREVTAEVIDLLDQEEKGRGGSDAGMSMYRLLQAVPLSYVGYFLHRSAAVARRKADATTRAQEVEVIESRILEEAARPETVSKPEALKERGGGGYADITFSVMKAIINDTGEELTANVPNRGTVLGIDDDAVVEVVCEVNRHGARALPVGPIPLAFRGLVQALKAYETLTVEAAMHRDRRLATLALMNHPLVGDLDIIGPLLSEMLEANGLVFIP